MYKWVIINRLLLRLADNASIQWPPAETDGFKAKEWMDAGNVPLPPDPAFVPLDLNDFNNLSKAFRAKCISDLAFRKGVLPGALTAADIQAERTRIKNIADALP
jgi:hypothetical protein